MAKLKGAKKAAFLRRMAAGRRKASKTVRRVTKRRRKTKRTNSPKKRRRTVARKRRGSTRRRISGGFNRITRNKFVRGAVLGLGGGALVVQVTDRFAPQFSNIAGPVGAFIFGGPVGFVAHLVLQGGLGGLFGGGSANGGGQTV